MASDEAIVAFVQSTDDPKMTRAVTKANYYRAKWARERAEAKVARLQESGAKRQDVRDATKVLRDRQASERASRLAWDASKAHSKITTETT